MKTCFFIGHREVSDSLLPILDAEVERHITEYGVTDFVVGKYGHFDCIAARCVKAAKKRHSKVTHTGLCIMDIGGMNHHCQQIPHGVYYNVPFASFCFPPVHSAFFRG